MYEAIVSASLKNKLLVLLGVVGLIVAGIYALGKLAIDAVPDITSNQVQVVTVSPTLAAQEVEQYITAPIERSMANLPEVSNIRSISRYGLSLVTVEFNESAELLKARQLVGEQLNQVADGLPKGAGSPQMMPITTGLGEIYQYVLVVDDAHRGRYSSMELRSIQDFMVKRQLAGVKGIIETSSFGGLVKQYEVQVNPEKLQAYDLTLPEVTAALEANNRNGGAGYLEHEGQSFYLRVDGRTENLREIEQVVIASRNGQPVRVGDIAKVAFGAPLRYGAMTMDGKGEVVGGITLMLKGSNAVETVAAVKDEIESIRKSLPEGVDIYPYLDRGRLVGKTIDTVTKNLSEGGIIVVLVLLLFLGNWRAGLIVASVIPLSLLFTFIAMNIFGVSANLMSLGAIDFGIVVDGAVIIVEGILFYLHHRFLNQTLSRSELDSSVQKASTRVLRSSTFGVLIILIVFIPLYMLEGIEGKMFKPMAMTVSFAIIGALLLSLTYVPVMASLVLKRTISPENRLTIAVTHRLQNVYRPALRAALAHPGRVMVTVVLVLLGTLWMFGRMGSEFIPTLEEGDLAMQLSVEPGSSLSHAIATTTRAEQLLKANFPEIKHVVSKIGTAEVPTDPMAIEDADVMIILKDREEWVSAPDRESLVAAMKEVLSELDDVSIEFTQPIQLRFNELLTGAKTDVAVKIFGEDNRELKRLADEAALRIAKVEGAADVKVDRTEGLRQLAVKAQREKLAAFGCSSDDVAATVETAYAGAVAGSIFENDRRFDLVVRMDEEYRTHFNPGLLFVRNADGERIQLSQLTTTESGDAPMVISREKAKRRIVIGVNTRNRDVASVVADIQTELAQLPLPPGYRIEYGGQFENLNHAVERLTIAVPTALLLIVVVLFIALGSVRDALVIFVAIPLAAIGGVWALELRDLPFSISAGIGFIALFGVAVLNGLVLINEFNHLRDEGKSVLRTRVEEGALSRLRPVLMTALVASLGFLPMALSESNGAEVQRPLATVVIGGLVTSTLLTLLVVPTLYNWLEKRRKTTIAASSLTLLLLLAGGIGQAQAPLSFDALEQAALQNRYEIRQAQLNVDEAEAAMHDVFRIDPLSAELQYGQINYPGNDYQVQVRQDLGNWFSVGANRRFAEARATTETAQLRQIKKEVRWALRSVYETYTLAGAGVSVLERFTNELKTASAAVSAMEANGYIDPAEAVFFETALICLQEKYRQALAEREAARVELCRLAGVDLDAPVAVKKAEPLVWQGAVTDSTLLLPLVSAFEAAGTRVEQVRKEALPRASIGGFNQSLDGARSFSGVAFGVSLPIFSGGVKRDIAYAKINQDRARIRLDEAEANLNAERERLERLYQTCRSAIDAYPPDFEQHVTQRMQHLLAGLSNGSVDRSSTLIVIQSLMDSYTSYLTVLGDLNATVLRLQYLTTL